MWINNKRLTKRIYVWTSITIILSTILFIVYNSYALYKAKRILYEKDLYEITNRMNNHLSSSYEDILEAKGASEKPAKDQVLALNATLQPLLVEIHKDYPNFGMGYYSAHLDRNVARMPDQGMDKLLQPPQTHSFLKAYETRQPLLEENSTSAIWGAPTLSISCPIFDSKGDIIGHTWANITLSEIYKSVLVSIIEIFLAGLLILALVLFIFRKIFDRLSCELNHLANALVAEEYDVSDDTLPELKPILDKIKNHITEIKEMQNKVKNSEENFSVAFNSSPHMMSIVSMPEGRYIAVNEQFLLRRDFSPRDVLGKRPTELGVPESEWQFILDELQKNGIMENLEVLMATKDGLKGTVLLSVDKIIFNNQDCLLFAYTDISEIKAMRAELVRLDRLNLVGQMAAGISHEIRNPMATVRGYLQLLGTKPQFNEVRPTFDLMISELDRANTIIKEYLSLAKTTPTGLAQNNLNTLLESIYPLIEADAFTQNKQIQFKLGEIPDLLMNSKEIIQLVLNLARNGLEAMKDEGCLTIKTYTEDDTVVLSVQDEGCGIPEEHLEKLGTPFFTTKGDGTGLGLAICYRIAHNHSAKIDVCSAPGGTTFMVRFSLSNAVIVA